MSASTRKHHSRSSLNALTRGLYAVHFKPPQVRAMKKMEWDNLLFEINANRFLASQVLELACREMALPQPDPVAVSRLLSTWAVLTRAISSLVARYHEFIGEVPDLNDDLIQSLSEMTPYDSPDQGPDDLR